MTSDRVAAMIDRLSSAFTKEPGSNLEKILSTIETEMQGLEDEAAAVVLSHQFRNASGQSLENMTETFGVSRIPGTSDTTLRENMGTVLWQNRSHGSIADVQKIVSYITGVPADAVTIVEPSPGRFSLIVESTWTQSFSLAGLYNAVNKTKAGGVLFLEDETVFILTAPLEAETGRDVVTGLKTNAWGWGYDAWGDSPWGGLDLDIEIGHHVITPIP